MAAACWEDTTLAIIAAPHSPSVATQAAPRLRKPFWREQYFYVLVAAIAGAMLGVFFPNFATACKPLGDVFISLIRMTIAPLIFLVVVAGIAQVGDMRTVGRIGLKAMVYFEIVTTICLVFSLLVARGVQPGAGVAHATAQQSETVGLYAHAKVESLSAYIQHMFPLRGGLDRITELVFSVVHIVVALAPIGAFGAMAFTVAKFGVATLYALGLLVGTAWAMMALFILLGLGTVCRLAGVRLFDVLRLLRTELLVVIGTSSSETAIPGMMEKLTRAGVGKSVAGLVIPAGYSFNLDGVALTLPMSVLFIAQVYGVELSLAQQVSLFVVMLFTSKGAAGVTGGAFAALAATVIAAGLPVEGLALLLGIDRFMSLGRAVTNTIGNAVAAIVVSKWDGKFDRAAWAASTQQASNGK